MTISQQLIDINTEKLAIKSAIEAKGVSMTGVPFTNYHTKVSEISGGGPSYRTWVRPSDWLTMPTITSSDNKFAGLVAVFDSVYNNYIGITANVSAGNVVVDWGDGTVEVFPGSISTIRSHNYSYASLGSDTISSRGYKQAIVTVYPETTGATMTWMQINRVTPLLNTTTYSAGNWLDLVYSTTYASNGTFTQDGVNIGAQMLERVRIIAGKFSTCFWGTSTSLHVFEAPSDSFPGVASLTGIMSSPGGFGIYQLGDFSYPAATTAASYLTGYSSLQKVGNISIPNATSMQSMFSGCTALQQQPNVAFDVSKVTTTLSMFNGCRVLPNVSINVASSINAVTMFSTCTSLETVDVVLANGVNMNTMFNGCSNLIKANITIAGAGQPSNVSSLFISCSSLQQPPLINTAAVTNAASMFSGCSALTVIPAYNLANATSLSNFALSCKNLMRVQATGMNATVSFTNTSLSANAINEIFTNLSSSGSGKTITVTGCPGAATCNTAIATSKGWTCVV